MRTNLINTIKHLSAGLALSLCAACSAFGATFPIGGTVSGLQTGESITLLDDGTDALKVSGNGRFTFLTELESGATYDVTVGTQPTNEVCKVILGTGTARGEVTSVLVTCRATFSIGGTVSGLKVGDSVTLLDNGADALTLTANGKFTFPTRLVGGTTYTVTVGTEPTGEKCRGTHGAGRVTGDVTNIAVTCTTVPTFTIGGTVSGLRASDSMTLLNNGADALTVAANGKFTFKTPLDGGVRYDVTVGTQPVDEDCRVIGGVGIVNNGDVTTMRVSCVSTFSVGGTISGLNAGDSVTLLDNRADALTLTTNGKFTFLTRLVGGAAYRVNVGTEPTGERCVVTHGAGRATGDVTNIVVTCTTAPTFTIGGSVSGLKASDSVTLRNNSADALTVTANGKFTFKMPLDEGVRYDVTVGTQPAGEDCKVTGGVGIVINADVTTIGVSCSTVGTHPIGGTVSGLKTGDSVTLLDDGGDALKVSADGRFTFKTPVASGTTYDVTVGTQPAGEICAIANGTGKVANTSVTNVTVLCTGAPTFTIGGLLSGLSPGATVTLIDNGNDSLVASNNGTFTFRTALLTGAAYNVTVGAQPTGETCTVTNGSGTVATSNVTSVSVSCKANPSFTIGGTVSGLNSGASVTLLDNGTDSLPLSTNGTFTFKTALATGATYNVTVGAQPAGETCTVSNAFGTVASANVTNIAVSCTTNTFTIGGTVLGLNSGASLTLINNGSDSLPISTNGTFTFKTALLSGTTYNVIISAQPSGETCTVTSGSGTVASANVTNVAVSCATNTFTVGGTLSGLNTGASVALLDNGTDSLTVSANGSFTFKTALASGASYNVTVGTQPSGEACTVSNGSGKVAAANVTSVVVSCATNTFTIGGTLSGLNTGTSVTLLDNGSDSLTIAANGSFAFKTALASGVTYNVTVGAQPTGETCAVANASGTVGSANVTTVAVSCKTNPTFTIHGTVSGLNSGTSVTLLDNGSDSLTVSINGTFTFGTPLASGATYNVAIGTQPSGETCTVANGSGTVASMNVTNVAVSCTTNTFTIGGTVSGLNSGASVTLLDNATDSLTINANGTFTFKTALASRAAYNVTVGTQPSGETCTVSNGMGTIVSANVTNIAVGCSSGTGGGSGPFWMPYTATPVPGTTGGANGLFVMPTNNLESSPVPQFITTATPHLLGLAFTFSTGSTPVIATPTLMIYAAAGADGNTHVYGLKIDDTSTLPTPTQISSLSLSPTQQICGFSQAQTSLADPTTVFTVLDVSPGLCGSGGDVFEVVHYLDSPSTAPTIVPINTTLIYTLYQHGSLAGLILFDSAAESLNLYADSTFTSPVQLITGAPIAAGLRLASLNDGTTFGGTVAYFNMTTAAGPALYRIDSSSLTLTQVHQGIIGATAVPDRNNLYFTDVTSSTTTVFYQVPLTGGTPMVLYHGAYNAGLSTYLLLGSDDSVLAFQFETTIGSPAGTTTDFFYTIPLGVTSTSTTTIGGPYVGNVNGFVAAPPASSPVGSVIFVTILNRLNPSQTSPYSSVALPFSGTTNTTPLANSAYPTLSPNAVVQITGITDMGGGQGGGTMSQINLSTLQGTPVTTTGGGPYVVPAGYVPGLILLGSNTMPGNLVPFPGDTPSGSPQIGIIGDLSKNFVFSISLTNTSVTPF